MWKCRNSSKTDLPTLFRDSDTQNQRGGSGSFAPDPSESALQRRAAALVFVQAHALPAEHPHASDFNAALLGPGGHGHTSYASVCTSIAKYIRRPLNDDVLRVANNAYHHCIASVRAELIRHGLAAPMVVREDDDGGKRARSTRASRHDTSRCQLSSFAQEICHLAPITACLTDTAFPIIAAAAQFIQCGMRPWQAAMRAVAV